MLPTVLRALVVPAGFSFPIGRTRGSGETSLHVLHWPGVGACCWCAGTSLILLMQSVLVSGLVSGLCLGHSGVLQPHPMFQGSLSGVLFLLFLESESGTTYVTIFVRSLPIMRQDVFEERKKSLDMLLMDLRKDYFLSSRPTCLLSLDVLIFNLLSCKYLFPATFYFSLSFLFPLTVT